MERLETLRQYEVRRGIIVETGSILHVDASLASQLVQKGVCKAHTLSPPAPKRMSFAKTTRKTKGKAE